MKNRFAIFWTRRNSKISNNIAKATDSEVSHVGVYDRETGYIYEARGDGRYSSVIRGTFAEMLKDPDLTGVWIKDVYVPDHKGAVKWLESKVGTPYDYFNTLVLQPIILVFNRLVGRQKKNSVGDDKYGCGEFTADWLKNKTYETINMPIAYYAPHILYNQMKPEKNYGKN